MPKKQQALAAKQQGRKAVLSPDPALRELLDHVARELAEEYVRLMKEAVSDEAPSRAAEKDVAR